jgi:hypothetical protein
MAFYVLSFCLINSYFPAKTKFIDGYLKFVIGMKLVCRLFSKKKSAFAKQSNYTSHILFSAHKKDKRPTRRAWWNYRLSLFIQGKQSEGSICVNHI